LHILQSMFDPMVPPGLQYYRKALFVDEITDPPIDIHRRHGATVPNMFSLALVPHLRTLLSDHGRIEGIAIPYFQ